ncbi:rap guanine nucleotide exchange factor 2-like isoform X8 [Penaeus japonicus]|uniref:rap guanine nucleotide exchange factor 2-like isoform X8 n=1 Tax=Penaeus japonicus TaxID=27405 RepID=UPI001C717653|nr:rap guanine nucleotide exchange factor 2-like isoform X8 [Penaeus japonicus]
MMKYSSENRLRRRNSCTALRPRPLRSEGDLTTTLRQPRVRRLSFREHSRADGAPEVLPPRANSVPGTVSAAAAGVVAGVGPLVTPPSTPTSCLGSDPSLRVSTILKRWNSHRERRLSDSRAQDAAHDTPPVSRKLSSCFGKRSGGGGRRANECLILEPSEMIVIDYPDVQLMRPGQRASCNTMNLEKLMALEQDEITIRPGGRGAPPPPPTHHHAHHQYENDHAHHHHHPQHHHHHHHDPYLPDLVGSAILRGARNRGSVGSSVRDGSDTSSAYSGSDTMCHSLQSSLEPDDVDLSGLTESAVDSDEEDLAESIESLAVRDAVRECLEKDPSERTEDDIDVLLEFTQRLRAFSNMTLAVRRAMCQAMVFAVVEEAGTTLMNHGEELDSWSVIINGHVEVTQPDGSVHELHLGDSLPKRQNVMTKNSSSPASFGITPTMEKLYHQGVMRSKVDDCQFVCIRQTDYYRILHQGEENTRRHEEDGVLVLVTEQRNIDAGNRRGNIVIKGTAERLMSQLVEVENNVDPTYVEDFLLTHRTFIDNPLQVANKLLEWFEDPSLRDRVTRVVLLWVNNHFTDFEMDPVMMNFLEQFEEGLEREKMAGQLRLLDFACATKARARTVTLTRPSRDEILHFSILGGYERGFRIFISKVEKGSKAEEVGLKRGDQILEVNGQSFDHMNHGRALEILRQTCHLSITVKSNLLAFKEMLQTPDNSPRQRPRKPSDPRGLNDGNMPLNSNFASTMNIPSDHTQQSPRDKGKDSNNKSSFMTMGGSKATRFSKVKNLLKPKTNTQESQINSDESVSSQSSVGGGLYHSHSNPDLSTTGTYEDVRTEFPEHVLKVYRATDQAARFLPVHKETTAREVVMLALQIFNINDPSGSSNYALYEVSVTEEGLTKQKRLPDSLQNLAERIGLSSRYYLKNITVSQTLVPDENVNELVRESTVYFLQLNSVELAIQLTLEDYTIFRQIEPTEYIDYLFHLNSRYGTPALSQFAELVNREMFWVVTEVCSEHNLVKRSKIIKQFIKVARQCKECKNFNSMFAILSGLGHGTVSRLKQTWERLPSKYQRMFHDMQDLMDPSRNMSKYRNLVQSENIQSPIIPFYPVVARDLTFTHEGNDDKVEGLINFEKLRMISRYIRDLQNMCSAPYDLFNMQDAGGQPPSAALITLNQMGAQIATVKRRKKSTAAPDKKKMYEEAQMVRRVKAYLARLQVITDEEQLRNMSLECEAGPEGHKPAGGHSNSSSSGSSSAPPTNPPPRRRPHSPTPSTTSSTSSTSQTSDGKKHTAKFGSVTSTDCQVGPGESDSGISTHFDCHSSSSLEVGGVSGYECHYHSSPPAHHRRYSHQPESRSRPPFPHAVAVLPPIPAAAGMGSGRRRGAPGHPPDYAETQMRMKQMGRALSHDGVQYYRQTHLDDEEEDAQVSAV